MAIRNLIKELKTTDYFLYLAALVLSLTFIFLLGSKTLEHKGVHVVGNIKPSIAGKTIINIMPFGQIQAKTHRSPIAISFMINKISADEVKDLFSNGTTKKQMLNDFKKDIEDYMTGWIMKLMILGVIGGSSATVLFKKISIRNIAICGLIGFFSTLSLVALTVKTYDNSAFNQPKFTGMLSAAPWLLDAIQKKFETFNEYKQQVRLMAKSANKFQSKVNAWSDINLEDETVKILFVSDIHNNPASLDIAEKAINDFDIDFIIDGGDITDYGTPIEARILEKIAKLKVSYIYVPGNHDSEEVIEAIKLHKNVIVLNNKEHMLMGFKIYGLGDPSATSATIDEISEKESEKLNKENYRMLTNMKKKPDIFVAHNPEYIKSAANLVGVTLSGHTHVKEIERTKNKGVIVNVGSTGGAGIRGIISTKQTPISYKVLYFNKKSKRLTAIDAITFYSIKQEFNLQRTVFDNEY